VDNLEKMIKSFNPILAEATTSLGISPLSLNDQGQCAYAYNDSQTILMYLSDAGQTLSLVSFIWDDVSKFDTEMYKKILQWNHSSTELGGSTLGLCQKHNKISLKANFELETIDAVALGNIMLNFALVSVSTQNKFAELFQNQTTVNNQRLNVGPKPQESFEMHASDMLRA